MDKNWRSTRTAIQSGWNTQETYQTHAHWLPRWSFCQELWLGSERTAIFISFEQVRREKLVTRKSNCLGTHTGQPKLFQLCFSQNSFHAMTEWSTRVWFVMIKFIQKLLS